MPGTQKAAPRGVYENTLSGAACSVTKQMNFFQQPYAGGCKTTAAIGRRKNSKGRYNEEKGAVNNAPFLFLKLFLSVADSLRCHGNYIQS